MVVIAIIVILAAMLMPALARARASARAAVNTGNLRQIGSVGMSAFLVDNPTYPWMSSTLSSGDRPDGSTKPRWPDYIYPYVDSKEVFVSPFLDLDGNDAIMGKQFWHEISPDDPMQVARADLRGFDWSTNPINVHEK